MTFLKDWHTIIHRDGGWTVDLDKLLTSPEVHRQLKEAGTLFKWLTIQALLSGTHPPHLVGIGTYTKKSLLKDWNSDWQTVLEEMNITYNSFFDIPISTTEEIVETHGSKKEKS